MYQRVLFIARNPLPQSIIALACSVPGLDAAWFIEGNTDLDNCCLFSTSRHLFHATVAPKCCG
jgi:hypothetical protein